MSNETELKQQLLGREAMTRFKEALQKIQFMAGMLPLTHGPDHEPVDDDEEVSVRCVGFSLGELTAGDLKAIVEFDFESLVP